MTESDTAQRWYKKNLPLSEEVQELNLSLDLMVEGVETELDRYVEREIRERTKLQ